MPLTVCCSRDAEQVKKMWGKQGKPMGGLPKELGNGKPELDGL